MTTERDEPIRYTVLSVRAIVAWSALVVVTGVGVAVWLLLAYTDGDVEGNRLRLDAIRTAGTVVVGTGGAAALLLAARRQRSAEIALRQKDRDQADVARAYALQERLAAEDREHRARVAAATEADAEARRITDLYTKAVEQLGSEKAPVRLGGFYALERLAQENPGQRQTIVNVVSAYLRMPPAEEAQEHEVRLTAQRLLRAHLRPDTDSFWPGVTLDLTGASLVDFDLSDCAPPTAGFAGARFAGTTRFTRTEFGSAVSFEGAEFAGPAVFDEGGFAGGDTFRDARFADEASFDGTRFAVVDFTRTSFDGRASFHDAEFARRAEFLDAVFGAATYFTGTGFDGITLFQRARFNGLVSFADVRFAESCSFRYAKFADDAGFEAARFEGNVVFDKVVFDSFVTFGDARFRRTASFNDTAFVEVVPPEVAAWWRPLNDES